MTRRIRPINWNKIEDSVDLQVWNKLTENFWLPEKIALSNDLKSWNSMTDEQQLATRKVFVGLTALDTIQGVVGAPELMKDAQTPHEEAVLGNINFMEAVHAKSYSSIFSTLCSSEEIEDTFRWAENNEYLLAKEDIIMKHYDGDDPHKKKIVSTLLESFLFYSGFYLPLYWSSRQLLTNTSDIIKLIIRDECLTEDHQLLTPGGWKNIDQITEEDLVIQYDSVSEELSFTNPVEVSSTYVSEVINLRTEQGHVDISASPNHRFLFEKKRTPKSGTHFEKVVRKANELTGADFNPYSKKISTGKLSTVGGGLSTEESLLVAISADGCFDMTTKNLKGELRRSGSVSGTVPASFSFAKTRKADRLARLANEAGWDFAYRGVDKRGRALMTLYVPVSYVDRTKSLTNIAKLDSVSYDWCVDFIEEISFWDGHLVRDSERITWGSVKKENADYVSAVASLAGYRVHQSIRPDGRSDTYSDYHRVQIHRGISRTGLQRVEVSTSGPAPVYGVEVPTGFILTRKDGGSPIITGNSVHGYYIGYKYQKQTESLPADKRDEYLNFTIDTLMELYDNEVKYTQEIYDPIGLTEDVKKFLKFNANKAMMNLGYDPLFSSDQTNASAAVMASLSGSSQQTHDFFSGAGSSYIVAENESTEDEDWNF